MQPRTQLAGQLLKAACVQLDALLLSARSGGATSEEGGAQGHVAQAGRPPLLPGAPLALATALAHGVLTWLPLFLQVSREDL